MSVFDCVSGGYVTILERKNDLIFQKRVRIELDALVTRLGGLQLRDKGLEKITRELLSGDYTRAVPQLQQIVNEGAKARLEKIHYSS